MANYYFELTFFYETGIVVTDGRTDGWGRGQTNAHMDGRINGPTGGRMDGRTDTRTGRVLPTSSMARPKLCRPARMAT